MAESTKPLLERHPQLYFEDGDVVLAAELPQAAVEQGSANQPTDEGDPPATPPPKYQLFRVHKTILGIHSAVFANMFMDASPVQIEVHDGAPFVTMIGDSAEPLAKLLSLVYQLPDTRQRKRWDPALPLELAPVVRLANKYLFDRIRAQLVQTVAADWPRTLEEWDRQEAEISAMRALIELGPRTHGWDLYGGRLASVLPDPAAAIRFATEFECPEILPAAFFRLACTGLPPAEEEDTPESVYSAQQQRARWELLHSGDFIRLLRGRGSFTEFMEGIETTSLADIPAVALCRRHSDELDPWPAALPANFKRYPCHTVLWHVTERFLKDVPRQDTYDPLLALQEILAWVETEEAKIGLVPGSGLCAGCTRGLKRWVADMRMDFWECLKGYFAP